MPKNPPHADYPWGCGFCKQEELGIGGLALAAHRSVCKRICKLETLFKMQRGLNKTDGELFSQIDERLDKLEAQAESTRKTVMPLVHVGFQEKPTKKRSK